MSMKDKYHQFRKVNDQAPLPCVSRYSLYCFVLLLSEFSCVAQMSSSKPYAEDLSVNRPKILIQADTVKKTPVTDSVPIDVKPKKNVNAKVDAILDSIDRFNLTRKFIDGYTLQVYSGQKREDAMNAKQKIIADTPDLTANLQYVQPKFRVTIGSYFTKLEAQKDLIRLKRIFPNTILVPEKILIK